MSATYQSGRTRFTFTTTLRLTLALGASMAVLYVTIWLFSELPPVPPEEEVARVTAAAFGHCYQMTDVPEYDVQPERIERILKWFRGPVHRLDVSEVPEQDWAKIKLGTVRITSRSGRATVIEYYMSGMGETRFSIGKQHYWAETPGNSGSDRVFGEVLVGAPQLPNR